MITIQLNTPDDVRRLVHACQSYDRYLTIKVDYLCGHKREWYAELRRKVAQIKDCAQVVALPAAVGMEVGV